MGTVISFPEARRLEREGQQLTAPGATATIMILPVIRIGRPSDKPPHEGTPASTAGRKRRRRARP